MVSIDFGCIVWVSNVEEALEHALSVDEQSFVNAVRSCEIIRIRLIIRYNLSYRISKDR